MTLLACCFGWVAKERRQSAFERKIGEKLQEHGAEVMYLGPYDTWKLVLRKEPQGWWRDFARKVLGEKIGGVYAIDSHINDLTPLVELKNLKWLDLFSDGTSTNVNLLAALSTLESLSVQGTSLADLGPLAELKNLKELFLYGDDGDSFSDLTPLADLKNLERLVLVEYRVSDEQVAALRAALPNCHIMRE